MKKVRVSTAILAMAIVSLTATSCKDGKNENLDNAVHSDLPAGEPEMNKVTEQSENASFNDEKATSVYQHYIHIKTALVNSNSTEAQSGAKMLLEISNDNALQRAVSTIADSDNIETQREAFSEVTATIEPILKKALASGKIYKQFCPMAFNNSGGYWFSNDMEIRNPYFGDKMLKCGKVTETIVKK